MRLIIVEGGTSTGKTTLAHRLSDDLGMRLYSKDDFKEARFDMLVHKPSLSELNSLEKLSWKMLFQEVKSATGSSPPLIVEANFFRSQRGLIRGAIQPGTDVVEIYCHSGGFTIFKRYVRRYQSGERNPGHRDNLWYSIVALAILVAPFDRLARPLHITPNFLSVGTNDFKKVDYQKILNFVKQVK